MFRLVKEDSVVADAEPKQPLELTTELLDLALASLGIAVDCL
jgi:hypothetical protein